MHESDGSLRIIRSVDLSGGIAAAITVKLPFSPPYDWRGMIDFLAARAIPGVETASAAGYRRTFALDKAQGVVEVQPESGESHLLATIHTSEIVPVATIVARLRRLFDLDSDIAAVDAHLATDPLLARRVHDRPGMRVPGAWDGFELAVRAVLGQQVSVAAATTFAGRLAAAHGRRLKLDGVDAGGGPQLIFPTAATIGGADLTRVGLTRARAGTLQTLGVAMTAEADLLGAYDTLDEAVEKLSALPGIGPWTAQYIAMRALRQPDAFPAADLGLLRAMATTSGRPNSAQLLRTAEAWRPWRAYAAIRLWMQ